MKVIALMPLKANSERVPGKNFKVLGNKPLFHWDLDTLKHVSEIDQIIINTDARELLKENGLLEDQRIVIRDRKKEICGDMVSMNLVIKDDVLNSDSDIYLMTHTTNPFLKRETIINAINKFKTLREQDEFDSMFSTNIVQERFYDAKFKPINHNPDVLLRTQDLPKWHKENSNLYLFTKESFLNKDNRIGSKPFAFEMDAKESVDIDTPDDWDYAESIIQQKYNEL